MLPFQQMAEKLLKAAVFYKKNFQKTHDLLELQTTFGYCSRISAIMKKTLMY